MNLPRAVVEAERKAEEALQRLHASRQPQQSDPEKSGEPDPGNTQGQEGTTAEPQQSAPAPQPAHRPDGDETWEARYKTLHGKYNAEVPRLHASLKERDAKLNSLTEEVEALKLAVSTKREPLINQEEVNEYGEPLVDLMRRAAREELSGKDAEIAELRKKVDSIEVKSVENKEVSFYDALASKVNDWMAVNDDPEFHAWLGEVDELTGEQRQSILSKAEEKRDADRVARFFNAFKKVQQEKSAVAQASLDSQIAPESSRKEVPQQGKKIWTRGEIADFYAQDRRGEFTEEKAAAIDAEIQLAIREKRVR